jgi:hypothetical protein
MSLVWPGQEAARLLAREDGWRLEGIAVLGAESAAGCVRYTIDCDRGWRTVGANLVGWVGARAVRLAFDVAAGGWTVDGQPLPDVSGCIDLDLEFSPVTNLLPIRRLGLAIGASSGVRAAWVRLPDFRVEPLDQTYRRLADRRYRYESGTGFACEIEVDEHGFVLDYPGLWERRRTG